MKKFCIEFNESQMKVLNDALVELPFKMAAPLIQHINAQIQKHFDSVADDGPTGATVPADPYAGD